MSAQPTYLLDADTLIRAKRQHYAPDICPGFWEALLRAHKKTRVVSIEPIRDELLRGKDWLADWVRDTVPDDFFSAVDDHDVQEAYAKVIEWAESSERYSRAAKQKFVGGADPWLIAVAVAKGHVLVTYEVSATDSKAIIKLPDVARRFKVKCVPPYVMLRLLNVVLTLGVRRPNYD